jgi:hypothetical protein
MGMTPNASRRRCSRTSSAPLFVFQKSIFQDFAGIIGQKLTNGSKNDRFLTWSQMVMTPNASRRRCSRTSSAPICGVAVSHPTRDLSHTMYQFKSFRKSTLPQNRQLIDLISNSTKMVSHT